MHKGNTQLMHDDGKKSIKSRSHIYASLFFVMYKLLWCHHIGIKQQEVIRLVLVVCEFMNMQQHSEPSLFSCESVCVCVHNWIKCMETSEIIIYVLFHPHTSETRLTNTNSFQKCTQLCISCTLVTQKTVVFEFSLGYVRYCTKYVFTRYFSYETTTGALEHDITPGYFATQLTLNKDIDIIFIFSVTIMTTNVKLHDS